SAAVVGATVAAVAEPASAPVYLAALLVTLFGGALLAARVSRRDALVRDATGQERLRIARDLHDIVGHGMGAITVQAGTGRVALDARELEVARSALATIEQASRDVLREVRWLVGLLRDEPRRPGLARIDDLADAARLAGLDVEARVGPLPAGLRQPVEEAAYRIVQEALTNVVRHAHDARRVLIEVGGTDRVRVLVRDDGTRGEPAAAGHGLTGMRERAAAVQGEVVAGPAPDGDGWSVVATLPSSGRPA
ncbi:MAG: sensor histidine kinase, partial [Actinomycetes bacterium]